MVFCGCRWTFSLLFGVTLGVAWKKMVLLICDGCTDERMNVNRGLSPKAFPVGLFHWSNYFNVLNIYQTNGKWRLGNFTRLSKQGVGFWQGNFGSSCIRWNLKNGWQTVLFYSRLPLLHSLGNDEKDDEKMMKKTNSDRLGSVHVWVLETLYCLV